MSAFRSSIICLALKPAVKLGSGKEALTSASAKTLSTPARLLTTAARLASKGKNKPNLDDFFDSELGRKIFSIVKQGNSDSETNRKIAKYLKEVEEHEVERRTAALALDR
jgi:hypothetical protein